MDGLARCRAESISPDFLKQESIAYFLSKQASNACAEGWKSTFLTKAHDSRAPCSRSIALSSHSTESGPL